MEMVIPKDNNVMVNGLSIHYLDWAGSGPPVICIPGVSANCWFYLNIAESLTPEYRVIAYDHRGRGDSDKPRHGYNLIAHTCDLEALMNVLEIEKAALFGGAHAAHIALFFAAHFPDRVSRLILGDGGHQIQTQQRADIFSSPISDRLRKTHDSLDVFLNDVASTIGIERNRYLDAAYTFDVEILDDGRVKAKMPAEVVEEEMTSLANYPMGPLYPRVKCPTLLMRAADPAAHLGNKVLVPREDALKVVESIPNCRLSDIAGTNHHTFFVGDHKLAAEALTNFLKE